MFHQYLYNYTFFVIFKCLTTTKNSTDLAKIYFNYITINLSVSRHPHKGYNTSFSNKSRSLVDKHLLF